MMWSKLFILFPKIRNCNNMALLQELTAFVVILHVHSCVWQTEQASTPVFSLEAFHTQSGNTNQGDIVDAGTAALPESPPLNTDSGNVSVLFPTFTPSRRWRAAASTDPMLSKWPRRFRVPYTFEQRDGGIVYTDQEQEMIRAAMQQVTQDLGGCVQFHPYNRRFDRGHDFLYLTKKGDAQGNAAQVCFTFSGRNVQQQGYGQAMILFSGPSGCLQDTRDVMRYLAMSLGLRGEAQRSDRDEHIKVYPENILPALRNFNLYVRYRSDENTLIGPYDYKSITHPDPSMYAVPGQRVFEILADLGKSIGDLPRLSYLDCLTLNILYACDHQCGDPYNDKPRLESAANSSSNVLRPPASTVSTNVSRRPSFPTASSLVVDLGASAAVAGSEAMFSGSSGSSSGGSSIAEATDNMQTVLSFPEVVSVDSSLKTMLENVLQPSTDNSVTSGTGMHRPRPSRPISSSGMSSSQNSVVGFHPPQITSAASLLSNNININKQPDNSNEDLVLDMTQPMNNICSPMFQVGAAMQTANKNIYVFSANRDAFYVIDALGFVLGGPFSIEQTGRFAVPLGGGEAGAPTLMPPIQIAWTEAAGDKNSHLIDSNGNEFIFRNERFIRHNGTMDAGLAITDQDIYWQTDAPIIVTDRGTAVRIGKHGTSTKVEQALPAEAANTLPKFIDAVFAYLDPTTDVRVLGIFAGFQFYQAAPEISALNDMRLRMPPRFLVDLKRWPVRRDELIRRC